MPYDLSGYCPQIDTIALNDKRHGSATEEIGFSSGVLGSIVVNWGKKLTACCPCARSPSGGSVPTEHDSLLQQARCLREANNVSNVAQRSLVVAGNVLRRLIAPQAVVHAS